MSSAVLLARSLVPACLAAVCACARAPAPAQPPDLTVTLGAAMTAHAPPAGLRKPVPTELRVYQLRSLAAFEAASYEELFDDDAAALGPSLIARVEERVFLSPERPWRGDLVLDLKARYLVVVAFLHRPIGRSWSYVAALPPAHAAGTPAPQHPVARLAGFEVRVGPDRLLGRPVYSSPPAPARRSRGPRAPRPPALPGASRAPSAPAPPGAPSPAIPGAPTPALPAAPTPHLPPPPSPIPHGAP